MYTLIFITHLAWRKTCDWVSDGCGWGVIWPG